MACVGDCLHCCGQYDTMLARVGSEAFHHLKRNATGAKSLCARDLHLNWAVACSLCYIFFANLSNTIENEQSHDCCIWLQGHGQNRDPARSITAVVSTRCQRCLKLLRSGLFCVDFLFASHGICVYA